MTSLLKYAVRLVGILVDESGNTRTASVSEAAEVLRLPRPLAMRALGDLQDAGLLRVRKTRVSPTVPGIALGVDVAKTLRQVHGVEVRPTRPFSTYFPEEVNL